MKKITGIAGAILLGMATLAAAGPGHDHGKHEKKTAKAGYGKCSADTQDCLNHMATSMKGKGWLGVEMDISDEGVITLTNVIDGSPADNGGFKVGDVLVSANGIAYGDKETRKEISGLFKVDNKIKFEVKRDGYTKKLKVVLAELPGKVRAQMVGHHMMMHAETPDQT
jgi:S1-C subfamily serine protease